MKITYFLLWWLWPSIYLGLWVVENKYGTHALGEVGMAISFITVIGSFLTGAVGIILSKQKQLSKLMLMSVAIAFCPIFIFLILVLQQI